MVTWLIVLLACQGSALRYIQTPPLTAQVIAPHTVPSRALMLVLTAELAIARGNTTEAEEALNLALLHDRGSPYLWLRIASIRPDANGKMAALEEAVRLGPLVPQTWAARAASNPDRAAALDDARKSVEVGESQEGRAVLCGLTGDADCVAAWSRLPLQSPAQAQTRGLARWATGDFAGAVEDLTEAFRAVGPDQWRLVENASTGPLRPTQTAVNNRVRDAWLSAVLSSNQAVEADKILTALETRWPGAEMWSQMRDQLAKR